MLGSGIIAELMLRDGIPAARIRCSSGLVPAPGQYLLAHSPGSDATLAQVLFCGSLAEDGFVAVSRVPPDWVPGTRLELRGPLGHGFVIPQHASRLALLAFDDAPQRLMPLANAGLRRGAAIALVCATPPEGIHPQIEVQPLAFLRDALAWADYAALDVARESLPVLGAALGGGGGLLTLPAAQVLVRVPMPCGALAECGVCSVRLKKGIGLACNDGPVFDLSSLDLESL